MVRRIASQVHKQASRLLLQNYIKREPAWFQAVLDHPPLPLPPREPPTRQDYDLPPKDRLEARTAPSRHMRPASRRPLPIHYVEDDIRRQFFKDHPFEAFRPRELLEAGELRDEHSISGAKWTRLRQRGRNPSSEDAIRFAVNLHEHHNVPLTHAYSAAVAQFRALRSEHQVTSKVALLEAQHYGMTFGPSLTDTMFAEEEKALNSWQKGVQADAMENAARKRWRMIPENVGTPGTWTKGVEYTRLWQEGVRPSYAPALASTVITSAGLETSSPQPTLAPPQPPAAAVRNEKKSARERLFMRTTGGSPRMKDVMP